MHRLCTVLLGCLLALMVGTGSPQAQQKMYVTDKLQVTVRSGPSIENKVIYVARTGEVVTILEGPNREGWAKVRVAGKEGWMMARYLQEKMPAALRLKVLDPQNKNLLQRLEELTRTKEELQQQLLQTRQKLEAVEDAYQRLQKEAAGTLKLKAEHAKLKKAYAEKSRRVQELTTEVESLRFGNNLKWFLAGAGVLVVGWLMGLAFGRRRRRSSTLY